MFRSRSAMDSLSPLRRHARLVGHFFILGVLTILFGLGLIRSHASTAIFRNDRRVLMHETGVVNVRSNIKLSAEANAGLSQSRERLRLDFFVAGFPKCGTTTMLYAFANHNETVIAKTEECVTLNTKVSDPDALNRLDETVAQFRVDPGVKRGLKCPSLIMNSRSVERMHNHSPRGRLVIGIRHPVMFFQSYYNYRVTEIYDRNLKESIPAAESLIGKRSWKGVSTDNARFDLFLKQLGKTNMTTMQMEEFILRPNMAVRPNTLKVFLYSLDQLDDEDGKRSWSFRSELQKYLDLRSQIPPFSHENLNNFVGDNSHPETIDICQTRYVSLREVLVKHGVVMEAWIRNEFVKSPDVTVANKKHFLETIRSWRSDPCLQENL